MQDILFYISGNRTSVVLGYLVLVAVWLLGTDYLFLEAAAGRTPDLWLVAKDWLFFGILGSLLLLVIASIGSLLSGLKEDQQKMRQAIMDVGNKAIVAEDLNSFFYPLADFLADLLKVDSVTVFRFRAGDLGLELLAATDKKLLDESSPTFIPGGAETRQLFALNKTTLLDKEDYRLITRELRRRTGREIAPVSGVIIPGEEHPLGLIILHSRTPRKMGVSNVLFLKAIGHLIGTTVVRKNIEDDLKQSLEEKQVLLAEIHHRVKNNLAIVSGLLELQLEDVEDEKIRYALQDSQRRIHSMAMIHEKLYTSNHFTNIGFAGYLDDLLHSIRRTYTGRREGLRIESHIEDVKLDIDRAIPLGLIVNELASNAFKHAFRGRSEGGILAELREVGPDIRLSIADDGVGLPAGFEPSASNSLGMKLVNTLAQQLNGSMEYRNLERGCEFVVRFPK